MPHQVAFLLSSLSLTFLLHSCGVGGPGFGANAIRSDQGNGIQHISVAPMSMTSAGRAIEAFHHSAQKAHPAGSYSYRYDVTKNNHARAASGAATIPYGAGPGVALGMLAGNIIALNQEKPSTYSVTGYTKPQAPLTLAKGSRVIVRIKQATDSIELGSKTDLNQIRETVIAGITQMGLRASSRGNYRLNITVYRSAKEQPWTTTELTLSGKPNRKAFVIAKTKKGAPTEGELASTLQESLQKLIVLR